MAAACSLGASSFKIRNLNLGCEGPKLTRLSALKTKSLIGFNGLLKPSNAKKSLAVRRCLALEAQSTPISDESVKKFISSGSASPSTLIPNSNEVESFLTELCDTTSIAEIELKVGGFRLYVMRNINGAHTTSCPPISASADAPTAVELLNSNGSAVSLSLIDKATDEESLVFIRSPRVGFFRISKTIKGKRGPPSCKEKQQVKEGQEICYVEQLGGELPVECAVSGEVVKILVADGAPVGYGDPIISILPSAPGI